MMGAPEQNCGPFVFARHASYSIALMLLRYDAGIILLSIQGK